MIAFRVSLNGEPLATAGLEALSVLSAIVTAKGVLGPKSMGTQTLKEGFEVDIGVGGLASESNEDPGLSVNWCPKTLLAVGDKITVEVIDTESPDPPLQAYPKKPLNLAQRERKGWEMAKEKYFRHKDKYENSDA